MILVELLFLLNPLQELYLWSYYAGNLHLQILYLESINLSVGNIVIHPNIRLSDYRVSNY